MKSKELIEKLKKLDPEGELDVVVFNKTIDLVERSEFYWDGRYERITRQPIFPGGAFGPPVKGERPLGGHKINLHILSIEDAFEWPDFEVVYENEQDRKRFEGKDLGYRKFWIDLGAKLKEEE